MIAMFPMHEGGMHVVAQFSCDHCNATAETYTTILTNRTTVNFPPNWTASNSSHLPTTVYCPDCRPPSP
jgi:hypothetical protein